MTEVNWLDEGEERAWRSLQMMQMRLNAELARDLSAHSRLSYQDYIVLVALTYRPDGQMRVFELGDQLGWEKSRISHQVTRMVARGLVDKYPCGADRRGQVVAVTDRGRDEITAAAPSHVAAVRRLFIDRLTPVQLGQMASVAETVLSAVAEAEGRRCATHCDGPATAQRSLKTGTAEGRGRVQLSVKRGTAEGRGRAQLSAGNS